MSVRHNHFKTKLKVNLSATAYTTAYHPRSKEGRTPMTSTIRLRYLAQELVKRRKEAGLTVEQVTERLGWSKGSLSYIELNRWKKAKEANVVALLDLYGVTGKDREAILELVRQTHEKAWWTSYRDVFPTALPGYEEGASTIRTFEGLLVPGLLQTREYATAVIRAEQGLTPQVVARRVEARMTRQKILTREQSPTLWAIIDEAALHRQVGGPKVMRAQIEHLIDAAAWPNVTIQVIPFSAGAHAAINGPFVILDFPGEGDAPMVYLEGGTKSLFVEDPDDVQSYNLLFEQAVKSALAPEETVGYLAELQGKYQQMEA